MRRSIGIHSTVLALALGLLTVLSGPAQAAPSATAAVAAVQAAGQTRACDDGSPSGQGAYTDTSDCAQKIAYLEGRGCTVSHDDNPSGAEDTLTISGCEIPVRCANVTLTLAQGMAVVNSIKAAAAFWGADVVAAATQNPCVVMDAPVITTADGVAPTFEPEPGKAGDKQKCGTSKDTGWLVARLGPLGNRKVGDVNFSQYACTNGRKICASGGCKSGEPDGEPVAPSPVVVTVTMSNLTQLAGYSWDTPRIGTGGWAAAGDKPFFRYRTPVQVDVTFKPGGLPVPLVQKYTNSYTWWLVSTDSGGNPGPFGRVVHD